MSFQIILKLDSYEYDYDSNERDFSLPDRFLNKYPNKELVAAGETEFSGNITGKCSKETRLLIIIDSNPRRSLRRIQIRENWAKRKVSEILIFMEI